MRRALMVTGLAAVAASLAAGPAAASVDSLVAAGPNKTAQFAWIGAEAPGIVQTRRMSASGTLGIKQAMSPEYPPAHQQSIGVDAGGNAVIAWLWDYGEEQRIRVRRRLATGALGSPQTVSPLGVGPYAMDVEPDGDAVVVWVRMLNGKYVVQARRRSEEGVLSPIYTISYAGANAAHPDVEVTPDGAATVVWALETDSPPTTWVQTRTIRADGTLTKIQTLSTHTTSSPVFPRLAVSDSGVATIAWVRSDAVIDPDVDRLVGTGYYRTRAPDGTLGPQVTLATTIAYGAVVVAGNGAGRTAFAWLDDQGGVFDTKARIREPGGPLNPVFDIGTGFQSAPPAAALDPAGNATFAWREGSRDDEAALVRRRSVTGAWGPRRVVSEPTAGVGDPHLAVDADGKATAVWFDSNAGTYVARTVKPGGLMSPAPVPIGGD